MGKFPDPKDWVVSRFHRDRRRVFIRISNDIALPAWIRKVCSCFNSPQLRQPADLLLEVRQKGGIDLGVISGREAHKLIQMGENEGLEVQIEDASFISLSPRCPDGGLIIEDETENESFCLQLIQLGANVQEIQD